MSDHFIGAARNGGTANSDDEFTLGTSTGATDIEVRIADAASWTVEEVAQKLTAIRDYIVAQGPANIFPYPQS
jgi:hypothetical protein